MMKDGSVFYTEVEALYALHTFMMKKSDFKAAADISSRLYLTEGFCPYGIQGTVYNITKEAFTDKGELTSTGLWGIVLK